VDEALERGLVPECSVPPLASALSLAERYAGLDPDLVGKPSVWLPGPVYSYAVRGVGASLDGHPAAGPGGRGGFSR
jgi:hypothetical protein